MSTPLHALIVFESMFGNTEKAARAVGEGLRMEGFTVEVREVDEAPTDSPLDVDLLVVGAPTHVFSLSRPSTRADAVREGAAEDRACLGVREWLSAATGLGDLGVATFDTRASKVRRVPVAAARRAATIATRRGFTVLSKPVGFVVEDLKGPISDAELERAHRWGRSVAGIARIHALARRARRGVSRS